MVVRELSNDVVTHDADGGDGAEKKVKAFVYRGHTAAGKFKVAHTE